MNVTFTLTAATSGTTAAGPFNISGTTSGNTTSQLATGITKQQLTTGYTINSVNDAITGGTIASTGTCNTTTTWSVSAQAPATATLSYSFSAGVFDFYLNRSLVDNIVISDASVNLFSTTGCTGSIPETAVLFSNVTITSGTTHTSYDTGQSTLFQMYTKMKQVNLISIDTYGTFQNGDTFTTTGGTVVTVSINTLCQGYLQ